MFQEAYYVDGTELILTDGTRILTLSDVKTDLYNYYWYEDGVYITISKSTIKKVDYFSFRELGRKPKQKMKNIHQRRIRGTSVVYQRGEQSFFKVLHVNNKGKNIEGMLRVNKVVRLGFEPADDEIHFRFQLEMCDPMQMLEFHFYNMKGSRVATALVDLEMFEMTKNDRKQGHLNGFFHISKSIDPEQIGLVEVVSNPKQEQASP